MSKCDHFVAGKEGQDSVLYRESDIGWAFGDNPIHFQYCPLCGVKHDWNVLTGATVVVEVVDA